MTMSDNIDYPSVGEKYRFVDTDTIFVVHKIKEDNTICLLNEDAPDFNPRKPHSGMLSIEEWKQEIDDGVYVTVDE